VEFRLLYSGQLRAATSGNNRVEEKCLIRKQLHAQLKQLWKTHPVLVSIAGGNVSVPDAPLGTYQKQIEATATRFSRCGFRFVPIVSEEMSLSCALDILFLRRDYPGNVIVSGGDIDNRLKTLLDALRMPSNCGELGGSTPDLDENPFYVLLEDDSLITKIGVSTDRLLLPEVGSEHVHDVRLVIGVTVSIVSNTSKYLCGTNTGFLGP
jgi:hypothetical protein